ncbi:MAG: hypothetical protein MJ106_05430, partial [Lentisphaeria bacterium]|nr:hypothetical protein [Lentisphaeria bacterium]
LVFDGSSVSFTGATKVDLQFADTWEFEIGGTDAILTWDSVANSSAFNYNNFSGDTLNLTFDGSFTLASGSEATIIKGCDNTLRNWNKFASVTLNGSDNKLTFDKTENAYLGTVDGSNYKLYVDDTSKSLLLSHLA